MKKPTCAHYIFFFLLLPFGLSSQINQRFVAETIDDAEVIDQLNNYFTDFSIVHLPAEEIEAFLQRSAPAFEITLIFPDLGVWEMTVEPAPILGTNFNLHLQGVSDRRVLPINTEKIHTFKAQNKEEDHRLTVNGDFIYGYTVQGETEWYIEPVKRFVTGVEAQTYVVYQSRNVRPIPNLKCGANDRAGAADDMQYASRGARDACYEVELAIAADYSMYEFYGSAGAVFAQLEGVINNVAGNFDTEFSDEVKFRISELVVSTCIECDVWTDTIDASNLLKDFKEWGLGNQGFTNEFDLAQFWSRRALENEGNSSVIGLAYVNAMCEDSRFHVLEDFVASAGYLRVLTAHEIGHNFGCIHNFNTTESSCFNANRPDFIMDPSLTSSAAWSDDISTMCIENSIFRIENTLANSDCLSSCSQICSPIYNLRSEFDAQRPALEITWSSEEQQEVRVRIRDLDRNEYQEFFTSTDSISLDSSSLELCTRYEILIDRFCGDQYGRAKSFLLSTESESQMRLTNIQTRNCRTDVNTYDLDLYIEYDEVYDEGFSIIIGDQVFHKNYTTSPQFVKLEGLPAESVKEIDVLVKSNAHTSDGCAAKLSYLSPDRACSYLMAADFDDCSLPTGWTFSNNYGLSSNWLIGDSTRQIVNFQNASNATTINGNCMAYFDDDMLGPDQQFSGTSSLLTSVMDLENYEEINLSLTYNFNAYYSSPHTAFMIDVFDGNQWVNLLTDRDGSGCLPSNAWGSNCNTFFEANLQPFGNPLLQLRFTYSDGGQWAEFVAMDDFMLTAVKEASILPVELAQFSAKSEGETVVLNWITSQELNNDFFEIERSTNGRDFSSIGRVNGLGNSIESERYSFVDPRPFSGINYYRLRQVDKDGAYDYSHIVSAKIDGQSTWSAYPNPITGSSTVFVDRSNNDQESAAFQLLNTRGQVLASYQMNPRESNMSVDVNDLTPGVYVLRKIGGQSVRLVK